MHYLLVLCEPPENATAMKPIQSRPMTTWVRLIAGLVLLVFAATEAGIAQPATSTEVQDRRAVIDDLSKQLTDLNGAVQENLENDAELLEIRLKLEQLDDGVLEGAQTLQPRLGEINSRLEQIGPPPGEGTPAEPPAVAQERNLLLAERAEINLVIGAAEKLAGQSKNLIEKIGVTRRELFNRRLYKRYKISDALNAEVYAAFKEESRELSQLFSNWWQYISGFKLPSFFGSALLSLFVAAVLFFGGRRMFRGLLERDKGQTDPSYLSRLSVAFWSTFVQTVAVAAFFAATMLFFDFFGVIRGDIADILVSFSVVLTILFFIQRLANAVLSPKLPNWRIIDMRSHSARTLVWLISAMAVVTGIDYLLTTISSVLDSPLSISVAKHFFATVTVGFLVILIGLVRPFGRDVSPRPWPLHIRYVLFAIGGLPIIAALLGYIGLARFVSQQIVMTSGILTAMYIGYLSSRAVAQEGALAGTRLGSIVAERYEHEDGKVDRLGLGISLLIKLFILVTGLPLILLLWGFQPGDIQAWVLRSATEFRIGSISFSLIGILTGLLVFIAGYFLTRKFQKWLDDSVMARGRVDSGVRNSIRVAVGYCGLALAAIIGISAAGIDLSNLALVAGALSLGIGFGLQNIVSNFVSGLILLAERPFKVGDWIVAGTVEGTVKKISVRATEIETFQRQTVVLPNSELINSAVGNWTLRNRTARVEIPVGVAYGTDPELVRSVLLEIGKGHPQALKNPEPHVLFLNFGDSSLDFELRLFLSDVDHFLTIRSEIRFQIAEAFAAHSIEIPFPQRDIHIKSPPGQTNIPTGSEAMETKGKAARSRRRKKPANPE